MFHPQGTQGFYTRHHPPANISLTWEEAPYTKSILKYIDGQREDGLSDQGSQGPTSWVAGPRIEGGGIQQLEHQRGSTICYAQQIRH